MNRTSIGSAVAKGALLLASVAFSIFVVELVLRSLGYQAIYEVYSKPSVLWQYDELLGWSHERGSKGRYVGPRPWPIEFENEIAINSLGLRGPEVAPLPPDGLRVVVLGDSMVAGFEVPFEQTFTAVMEHLLTDTLSSPVQVLNAGVRGYGTDQSFLYYRERGRALQPHLVLMWLSVNDLVNDITLHRMRRIFGKPAFVPEGANGLRLVGSPVPDYPECSEYQISEEQQIVRLDGVVGRVLCRLQMTIFDRSALFCFLTRLVPWEQWGSLLRDLYYVGIPQPKQPSAPRGPSPDSEDIVITDRILRALAHTVEDDGGRFVIVSTPTMLGRFEERGVSLDTYEVIALGAIEEADPREVSFVHDSHLNAKGHRIVAESLRDALLPALQEIQANRVP